MDLDVVRAWKDEAYRESLSERERSQLLQNPVGELTDDDLQGVYGGGTGVQVYSVALNGQQLCPDMGALKKLKHAKKNVHINVKGKLNIDQLLNTLNSQIDSLSNISDFNP